MYPTTEFLKMGTKLHTQLYSVDIHPIMPCTIQLHMHTKIPDSQVLSHTQNIHPFPAMLPFSALPRLAVFLYSQNIVIAAAPRNTTKHLYSLCVTASLHFLITLLTKIAGT